MKMGGCEKQKSSITLSLLYLQSFQLCFLCFLYPLSIFFHPLSILTNFLFCSSTTFSPNLLAYFKAFFVSFSCASEVNIIGWLGKRKEEKGQRRGVWDEGEVKEAMTQIMQWSESEWASCPHRDLSFTPTQLPIHPGLPLSNTNTCSTPAHPLRVSKIRMGCLNLCSQVSFCWNSEMCNNNSKKHWSCYLLTLYVSFNFSHIRAPSVTCLSELTLLSPSSFINVPPSVLHSLSQEVCSVTGEKLCKHGE